MILAVQQAAHSVPLLEPTSPPEMYGDKILPSPDSCSKKLACVGKLLNLNIDNLDVINSERW